MLATDVKEKDYSIYKSKNIIDGDTLNLIEKVENEINRNNNDEVVNNEKIIEPSGEYPPREEIDDEYEYREKLFSDAMYSAIYDLFGYPYESKDFANADAKKELGLYAERVSETSKNFENFVAEQNYTGYETSWPADFKELFYNTCDLIKNYYNGPVLEHLVNLCKYVEMGDELADEQIKLEKDIVKKEVIGRGWALTKAKLYFRIKSCINTIREKLPNNIEEKNELIENLENSLPGKFSDDIIEGIYYGNTENNLINQMYSLAYNFNWNNKNYDICKDERIIDEETLDITKNNLNTNKVFYDMNEIDGNNNIIGKNNNIIDINEI